MLANLNNKIYFKLQIVISIHFFNHENLAMSFNFDNSCPKHEIRVKLGAKATFKKKLILPFEQI